MMIFTDTKCAECDGSGYINDGYNGDAHVCDVCNGAGYELTPLGKEVLTLLENVQNSKRTVRQIREQVG